MGVFREPRTRRNLRRALTAAGTVAGAAVLALSAAACGGGSSADSAVPSGGTPVEGGTVTYALQPSTVPNYIFPFDSSAHSSVVNAQYFQYLMYRPLYWFGNGTSPTLNASLSLADPPQYHGRQVTIRLKGWKWSDGETVSASDVLFWIHMLQAVGSSDWGAYVPGGFPDNVSDLRAENATTITMTMDKAYNPTWFTSNELSQITPMPQAWDMSGPGQKASCATTVSDCAKVYSYLDGQSRDLSGWAGSAIWSIVDGPWKLSHFTPDGNSAFVPNPDYSGPVKPRIAKFEEVPFTTDSSEYHALRSGNTLDVGYIPTDDAPRKAADQTAGRNPVPNYYLDPQYAWSINYFPVNYQSTTGNGPIIKQLYFRQALQYVMNQKAVIDGPLHGYGKYTVGPVGTYPTTSFLSPRGRAGDPFGYNPAKAKQLLEEHGWNVVPNGTTTCSDPAKCGPGIREHQPLSFNLPYRTGTDWIRQEMAQLQSNAGLLGIRLHLEPKPFDQVTALAGGNCVVTHTSCAWDMGNWGEGRTFVPDYYPSGETLFLSGSGANSGGYTDSRNDTLINQTLTEDGTRSLQMWQDYLSAMVPVIWQPQGPYQLTEISNRLRGVVPQSATLNLNPENWFYVK